MKNHKANMRRLIDEHGISQATLAKKMNMLPGTFSNKFRKNHTTEFTAEELAELREFLLQMADDIQNTLSEPLNLPIPIVVNRDGVILDGHHRYAAAKKLGTKINIKKS